VSLGEIFRTLRRRWVVLAVGAALTAVAGWLAINPTPTYRAVAVVTLRAPRNENLPNQFNDGRPSIALTGALISARLKSRSGDAQLRADGVVGDYDLKPRNSGTSATPAYLIASVEVTVVTDRGPSALSSLDAVLHRFDTELDAVQAEWRVPEGDWIKVAVLNPPSVAPTVVVRSRALLGVAVLGTIASLAGAMWLDRWLVRRRKAGRGRPAWLGRLSPARG
jgi:hypothetical protein